MLKRFVFIASAVAAVAFVAPYVVPAQNGKPLLDAEKIKLPPLPHLELPRLPATDSSRQAASVANPGPVPSHNQVQLYRWQDEDGQWHFTNHKPGEKAAEAFLVNKNVNLMHIDTANSPSGPSLPSSGWSSLGPVAEDDTASPYTPDGARQLVEQARGVQKLVDEHKARQDAIVGAQ